jgi:hypothetical protein
MERFIETQNIARFTKQLETATDVDQRAMIACLLREERRKLAKLDRSQHEAKGNMRGARDPGCREE